MIAVVTACGANFTSVVNALKRLNAAYMITSDAEVIQSADKVILPGVGSAQRAMHNLRQKNLVTTLQNLSQPVLGICLGMQLLFEFSEENTTSCLNIIPGRVRRFKSDILACPHMGWNQVSFGAALPLFFNIPNNEFFYFCHSYYVDVGPNTLAQTDYGQPFSAIVRRKNFFGMQFHPEKSGGVGFKLLDNFLRGDYANLPSD